ncbi:hypothetical protein [Nostoc sp.]|uniref:hypothetical protein n=1 Tax=Nostoc sp. TaxID=1180 RepID=UPI002FF8D094
MKIHSAVDVEGKESDRVLLYAYLNAASESGYINPIDAAIREYKTFDISDYQKLDEVPYDFNRKRLSILFKKESTHLIITTALPAAMRYILKTESDDRRGARRKVYCIIAGSAVKAH